jgi:hypothetical protein
MAKRKKAANIAAGSASGFTQNPLLQAIQGAGQSAIGTVAGALGLGAPGGGQGGFNGASYLEANPDVARAFSNLTDKDRKYLESQGFGTSADEFARFHSERYPGRSMGAAAQGSGGNGQMGAFQNFLNSLGYQSQLRSGQEAITTSNAARGILGSGATGKALVGYGQDLARQGFGQYLQNLQGLASAGQNAATDQASAQQQGELARSNVWLQPGGIGKAFSAAASFM